MQNENENNTNLEPTETQINQSSTGTTEHSTTDNSNAAEQADAIAKLGEKYYPGWFDSKHKKSLIWSSAAAIIGGALLVAWAFVPDKPVVEPHSNPFHKPYEEISVNKNPDTWPAVFQNKQDKLKVIKGFTTEIRGLNGWIVEDKNGGVESQSIAYTNKDGTLLFIGGILNKDGENVTMSHFNRFGDAKALVRQSADSKQVKEKKDAPEKQVTAPVEKSNLNLSAIQSILSSQPVISFGSGPKKLTIVIDPNCPYCHQYYLSLVTDEDVQKEFQINFLPVGILGMDSVKKAAMFSGLDESKAKALLKDLMLGKNIVANPTDKEIALSMARTQKWNDAGLNVVPMTIANFDNIEKSKSIPGVQKTTVLRNLAM